MVALLDKRYAKRYGCDGEIIWSYFNTFIISYG
jgi:hypothetical protein